MESKSEIITKLDVSKSCFWFLLILLIFLLYIPNGNNFNYLSSSMIIVKIISGLFLMFVVAFNGASFIYKLLGYLEKRGCNGNNS